MGMAYLSLDELETLRLIAKIFSSFSLIGVVFVQVVFWFFRSIRTLALELVAWLCFSTFFFTLHVYLPVNKDDNIKNYLDGKISMTCAIQAFINILFDLSSMIWTTVIGYTAYISVNNQYHLEHNKKKYRIGFIIVAYIAPLAFTLIVMLSETYGPGGAFCWIAVEANTRGTQILIIIYYCLTWTIIVLNCFFVIKVIFLLKKELKNEETLISKYISKLKWYPVVQILSYIPCTVNRIYNLTSGQENFTISISQVIADSLTGLMFSLVYGLNSSVRQAIGECLGNLFNLNHRGGSSVSVSVSNEENQQQLSKTLTYIEDSISESSV